MQKHKILIASALVILTLSMLATGPFHSNSSEIPKKIETAITKTENTKSNKKDALRYTIRQRKIQTALIDYFNKAIANGDIVGAGVSIVKGDSILISEGFGKKKSFENSQVNGETVFRLGSLSKGFAGILAANIKNEGKRKCDTL